MHVGAIITLIGTLPFEAVQVLLDSLDEIIAGDDCVNRGFSNLDAGVGVNIDVGLLQVCNRQVVGVLALLALLADTRLKVRTQSRLVVNLAVLGGLHLSDLPEERLEEISLFFFGRLRTLVCSFCVLDSFCTTLISN